METETFQVLSTSDSVRNVVDPTGSVYKDVVHEDAGYLDSLLSSDLLHYVQSQ